MALIILGLLIWIGVHMIPVLARDFRATLISKLGEGPYKGAFAGAMILAIVLIVFGWRSMDFIYVYDPPGWGLHLGMLIILIGFLLMGSSHAPTIVKQYVRHPQLTGVVCWAVGHLLANGDVRSILLFGGLGLWAAATIPLLNGRDGAWIKPEPATAAQTVKTTVIGVVVFLVVYFLHPYLFGVAPVPG